MKRLSKNAKVVLHALCSQYHSRRLCNFSKSEASSFGSSESIHDDLCQSLSVEDIVDAQFELSSVGYLIIDPGDDSVACCELTHECIADIENVNLDTFMNVTDFILKFKR